MMPMQFINLTSATVRLTRGEIYPPLGITINVNEHTSEDTPTKFTIDYIPQVVEGTFYIVTGPVCGIANRMDFVTPDYKHQDCTRDEFGNVIAVPHFICYTPPAHPIVYLEGEKL